MKLKSLFLPIAFLTLIAFIASAQTVVTFDDERLPNSEVNRQIYYGLGWRNFGSPNVLTLGTAPTNGYYYGMVSAPDIAVNLHGLPSEIDALGTNFNFLSAFLTGAWRSNLNIEVQGFRAGNLVYDQTIVASATNPTLFTFGYTNIDRLYFNSFGGEVAFDHDGGSHFAMDNFSFEFVPEPSALLLTFAGALLVRLLLKRRRA